MRPDVLKMLSYPQRVLDCRRCSSGFPWGLLEAQRFNWKYHSYTDIENIPDRLRWCRRRQGRAGEVYNIGGHNELQNIDIVKLLCQELRKPESLIIYFLCLEGSSPINLWYVREKYEKLWKPLCHALSPMLYSPELSRLRA